MSKQIGICLTLILTLICAPAACQARYLNPNTGRFWPVDSFEGHNHDPQSLHKLTNDNYSFPAATIKTFQ